MTCGVRERRLDGVTDLNECRCVRPGVHGATEQGHRGVPMCYVSVGRANTGWMSFCLGVDP